MKQRETLHYITDKGDVNILRPPRLQLVIRRQKHKSKRVRTRARNFNFECHWLVSTTALNVIGLLNCPITYCPIKNCTVLPGFYDLGRLVTPSFLLMDHFLYQFSTLSEKIKKIYWLEIWFFDFGAYVLNTICLVLENDKEKRVA